MRIDKLNKVRIIEKELEESDAVIVRFFEDLLTVLIRKKILDVDEIPEIVRHRVVKRKTLRLELKKLKEDLHGNSNN